LHVRVRASIVSDMGRLLDTVSDCYTHTERETQKHTTVSVRASGLACRGFSSQHTSPRKLKNFSNQDRLGALCVTPPARQAGVHVAALSLNAPLPIASACAVDRCPPRRRCGPRSPALLRETMAA
jgi:hypothetical protein